MSDAPKEIWASSGHIKSGVAQWEFGEWENYPDFDGLTEPQSYTRTDIHEAELSALCDVVLEEAAQVAEKMPPNAADKWDCGEKTAAAIRQMKGSGND